MHCDIVALRTYYASTAGRLAERAIGEALAARVKPYPNERILGFGYALPWLEQLGRSAERMIAFMPAGQGAQQWPKGGPSATALVFEEDLPLPDSAVDTILMAHALEHAQSPRDTLAEFWRVLAPNGRLVIIVPNRRGLWARFDHTPFGTGRPYTAGQVCALLREANFSVDQVGEALHYPPFRRRALFRLQPAFEAAGRRFWPIFAGVHIIEARKHVFQGLPVAAKKSRRVFAPVLAPQAVRMRGRAEGMS
ncbi:MAG: class I SAM-dependent methyltransferase [Rhizobiaceae bacterium]|jgi:SAM-dependent methyltransferase|nr:class I SAM-dependent methyltransferase [Rhizobiaceae bacterium]